MYKIMYNEIGRCGAAHRLRRYEDYCTCMFASSALLPAVSLPRAQFRGKRAQTLFAGMTASIASLSNRQFRWKEDITHPGMVSKPEKTSSFGPIQ
jgi:hypothetical protein